MITKVTFLKDYRCFKEGECYSFQPGVNLLVGDQGCGKSSLLTLFGKCKSPDIIEVSTDKLTQTASFDFEHDNLRTQGALSQNKVKFKAQVAFLWSSHGQSVNYVLNKLDKLETDVLFMDEPDMALSIRSILKLVHKLQEVEKLGKQIITAVHNPLLISKFDSVLSLEHKTWMNSKDFIKLQEVV